MSTIESSMETLKTIFDYAKVGIAICDAQTKRIEMVNPAFAAIHGYEPHELIGMVSGRAFAPECMFKHQGENHRSACTYEDTAYETLHTKKDGSTVPVEVHVTVLKDELGSPKHRIANVFDITERRRGEEALVESLEFIEGVLHALPDLLFEVDGGGTYLNVWTSEPMLLALQKELLLGKTVYDILDGESADICMDAIRIADQQGKCIGHQVQIDIPGGKKWFELSISKLSSADERGRFLVLSRDITERKASDRILHTLTEAINVSSESVYLIDLKSARFIYVNDTASRQLGYRREELLGGMRVFDIDPDFGRSEWHEHVHALKTKGYLKIQTRHRTKSGRIFPVEVSTHYYLREGCEYNLAIVRDITEQKKTEASLRENEARLREAQKIARIGSWELDFFDHSLTWSDEIYRIFEIDPGVNPSYDLFLDAIHPEERSSVEWKYAESVVEKNPYDGVHRILMGDGRVKYVHARAETTFDSEGNPLWMAGTVQDITERKNSEQQIEHMALHDALTGLPNRVLAKERMEEAIRYCASKGTKAALLFIDLDGFKIVNDTLSHSIGDVLLKKVSDKLRECIRSADTLCRLGGDEFLLILSGIEREEDIRLILTKIFQAFDAPLPVLSHQLPISMSVGISLYPDHADTFEALLQKSDMAMYKAKDSGKNGYYFYDEQMNHTMMGQFKLHNDLKQAINEEQFILHYQPQIDLVENRIIGVEALIRWRHPLQGMIPPMQFISLAENSGLIVQIGEWVIREACAQTARWSEQGIDLTVAVNISGVQFKRGNLYDVVKNALEHTGINPAQLELELTESIMMQDTEKTLRTVDELKNLGTLLSIDDFGTGYSSLAYLKRFAVDKLKIDQSFVRDILHNPEDAVIVKTIVQMAKSLNLKTIAEGVENQAVLDVIESYGCDEVQGYHFAKPLEAAAFEHFHTNFYKGE
jgi:diguanylate cyclase (GGDEF)-like protein/PAS domain S-box-containing protein